MEPKLLSPTDLQSLVATVEYNLVNQHLWTSVKVHNAVGGHPLPRPLISGVPPTKIYVHPDDLLSESTQAATVTTEDDREWVLPTSLLETWGTRKFVDVFDALPERPEYAVPEKAIQSSSGSMAEAANLKKRSKRLLLATISDDSTVVYYIIHDGIVKPRQN